MKRKFFNFFFLIGVIVWSCGSDDDSKVKANSGALVVDASEYEMSQMIIETDFDESPGVEFYISNGGEFDEVEGTLFGTHLNYVMFDFDLPVEATEIPLGTFVVGEDLELDGAIVYINRDTDHGTEDLVVYGLDSGTLEISKDGSQYELSFTGIIDGTNVMCSFEGKAKVYDND